VAALAGAALRAVWPRRNWVRALMLAVTHALAWVLAQAWMLALAQRRAAAGLLRAVAGWVEKKAAVVTAPARRPTSPVRARTDRPVVRAAPA
jgi:hypothetical protein